MGCGPYTAGGSRRFCTPLSARPLTWARTSRKRNSRKFAVAISRLRRPLEPSKWPPCFAPLRQAPHVATNGTRKRSKPLRLATAGLPENFGVPRTSPLGGSPKFRYTNPTKRSGTYEGRLGVRAVVGCHPGVARGLTSRPLSCCRAALGACHGAWYAPRSRVPPGDPRARGLRGELKPPPLSVPRSPLW